jgi:hypothetical protein
MTDVPSDPRAPGGAGPAYSDPVYPAETYASGTYAGETYPATGVTDSGAGAGDDSKAKQVAGQAKDVANQSAQAAGAAAGDVKDTAKEQAQRVGSEAKTQVRNVASDVRDRVSDRARSQNDKLVTGIRQAADQLEEMRGDRQDSPAATVVSRIADGGRQLADYLDRNGPDGVLREVQDFARRRPGAFLATALAAGFVVGRLGKGIAKADDSSGTRKPSSDSFVSGTESYSTAGYGGGQAAGYPTGGTTGYPAATGYTDPAIDTPRSGTEYAATGSGTPVVVEEEYVLENPEDRR